jgi:tRNA-specific 2-thiouridylase
VGSDTALDQDEYTVSRCNWIAVAKPEKPVEALVKIRYNHPGVPGVITPMTEGRAHVKLSVPQRAITPGQASVFYDGDLVVGGGWIEKATKA